jgi:hypothetical protein
MNKEQLIIAPKSEADSAGAERVLKDFARLYQPTILQAATHLSIFTEKMEPAYAAAYSPWQTALMDLAHGLQLMVRKIAIKDIERFMDALHMFSFEGAIQFLYDLCKSCKIQLHRDWQQQFRQHVDMLLFSLSILNREMASALAR